MAKFIMPLIGAQFLILLMHILYGMGNSTSNKFETMSGMKVKGELTYMTVPSLSLFQCAAHCAENQSCLSSSYNNHSGYCQLSEYQVHGPQFQQRLAVESSYTALSKNWCDEGWTQIGETCYYFLQDSNNYTEAKNYCLLEGGKLAEPQTNTSFQLLRTYMVENLDFHRYWFGLYDEGNTDIFVWTSDGVVPVYTAWADNEPDHWIGHDCVRLFKDVQYKWEDALCSYDSGAVCEK